ncbi:MAG: hypothetical protein AAGA30_01045 [Planctomycetota bacterium]
MNHICVRSFGIVLLAVVAWTNPLAAQDFEEDGNSRFILTLNEGLVNSLKTMGTLQSPTIADNAIGKINAIEIGFQGAQSDGAVEVNINPIISGNALQIELPDAFIEQIQNQAIRVNVPTGSQFSKVFLSYKRPANQQPSLNTENLQPMASANSNGMVLPPAEIFVQHFVKLSDSGALKGQMDLTETIQFETKFGEVDIALGQIAGIRFHIDGADGAIVVLKNGDSITGVPNAESFELTTDWGRAELDPVFIESITTSPNAQFRQSNEPGFGPRWQLIGN